MNKLIRLAVSSFLIVAANNASAGVITQDGVVFTSTYNGNVLNLRIDAANRSGGWATASAINALSIKTVGTFSGVTMSSQGSVWSLTASELNAGGCSAVKGKTGTGDMTRLCYTGPGIALADDMQFNFTFTGSPDLSAPHLKVRFVDAQGRKTGSLLSLDFPVQGPSAPSTPTAPSAPATPTTPTAPATPAAPAEPGVPTVPAMPTESTGTPVATAPGGTPPLPGGLAGSIGGQAGAIGTAPTGATATPPDLIPSTPVVTLPGTGSQLPGQEIVIVIEMPGDDEGDASEVPEPESLAILGLGLATMGVARRRKAQAAR